MKKKLNLNLISVKSFVTKDSTSKSKNVKGGDSVYYICFYSDMCGTDIYSDTQTFGYCSDNCGSGGWTDCKDTEISDCQNYTCQGPHC